MHSRGSARSWRATVWVNTLLGAGADISTTAGHASMQTTARYDRRGEEAKRKAVSLLHVEYRRTQPKAQQS